MGGGAGCRPESWHKKNTYCLMIFDIILIKKWKEKLKGKNKRNMKKNVKL